MKSYPTLAVLISLVIIPNISSAASFNSPGGTQQNAAQQKLAKRAKITQEQAQETALKRAPGTVESSELEKEHGKLVYSFDIRNAKGTIDEVQVSAITGKIVRVEHENKKQEEAEKRADQKKKP